MSIALILTAFIQCLNHTRSTMAAPTFQPTKRPSRPSLIYIVGGPGVGKGSLCTPLPKQFTNVYHLSVGDHLRDLQAQGSSQSTALRAIADTAADSGVSNPIVLVDGFPRSFESASLANARWGVPQVVLLFECPRELAEARFLNRRRSSDDSVDIFRMRFDEFEKLNGEIVEMYSDIVLRVNTTTEMHGETWDGLHGRVGALMEELGGIKSEGSREA